jgi:nucleoside-diphosphate-sugar epimerase
MKNQKKTALVVGANGVIGTNLIDYLKTLNDWEIIGISRRGGQSTERVQYISVDLINQEDCREKLQTLTQVTHIFYAAYQDRPTWAELVEPNMMMLKNTLTNMESIAENLQHISIMQGYKVYGGHLGPFKTPAKESDPQFMPPEFMLEQQNYLEKLQIGKSWTWTAIRPSVVCGFGLGNPMNLAMVIAVYATISKELNLPLRFPGKPGVYDKLLEMTDAGLLAKAIVWAATTSACANQAFNINNGDLFRWNDMWPKIANYFELDTAPTIPIELEVMMADKEDLWNTIIQKHDLDYTSYSEVSSWGFGDFVWSWDYDMFADGSKARRLGFHEYVDTEKMFRDIFDDFRARKMIP